MTENEIAKQILDAAFAVHTKLRSGVTRVSVRGGNGLRTAKERPNPRVPETNADIVR